MGGDGGGRRALADLRVVDLSTGVAGPLAAMLLGDFGADVVKVEPPGGDPARSRPGFAMWNRAKRSVELDADDGVGRRTLDRLLAAADVCVAGGPSSPLDPAATSDDHPRLVYLDVPPYLGETPWAGGHESAGLLWAMTGMSLRQSSTDGGPVDPCFPHMLYLQGVWAAAAATAALLERESSGRGQVVTVGGVHGTMVAATSSLVVDPEVPAAPASFGPGGPHPMYTRYRCADGEWLFLATLTPKFQDRALGVLGLSDLLEDPRLDGRLETVLLPANRAWVRERFTEVFASRRREEWLEILRAADVPSGPLLRREDWMASAALEAVGMRAELVDPERGLVVMPGNPVNLVATPAVVSRSAPRLGEHDPEDLGWSRRPAPGADGTSRAAPLAGVRVLDLGTILAGPYAGTLLAELGADVIKVEVPAGDSWRERGMAYIRGQRGLAVDLRSEGGRQVFSALVRTADVVLDNYRYGVLERLQIDYDHLVAVNPDIVSVSITGFGERGPFASYPAFDPLLQARSGMMAAQGGDGEPVLMTVAVNDVTTASLAVLGTLLALFHRQRGGGGQRVWLSLAGTSALAQCEELIEMAGRSPAGVGGRDFPGPGALDRSYAVSDGWVRIEVPGTDVGRLVDAGLLEEPASTDAELTERLAAALATMGRNEAVARLAAQGIPAAPVRRLAELVDDPDFSEWEVFNVLERGDGTSVFAPGRYARFSRSQHHETLRPPGVGEHTAGILAELGYDTESVDELAASGAVRLGSPMVVRSLAAYR